MWLMFCTKTSYFDPCIFIGDMVIIVDSVDDIYVWSTDKNGVNTLVMKLNK